MSSLMHEKLEDSVAFSIYDVLKLHDLGSLFGDRSACEKGVRPVHRSGARSTKGKARVSLGAHQHICIKSN